MIAGAIERHVDRCDGAEPTTRFQPRPTRGSRLAVPLDEVVVHAVGDEWHLVTLGLSAAPGASAHGGQPDGEAGPGFELTLRLERDDGETPTWAVDLLTNLASYVRTGGHPFGAGHHLDLRGPIRLGADTTITAAAVVRDPVLGELTTRSGTVEFLQVVGLTADELELCRRWTTDAVIGLLAASDPHLVTRLGRPSLLADPATAALIARRVTDEGSSLTELRVATLSWRSRRVGATVLTIGSGASAALGPALRRELVGPGASFSVVGDRAVARFAVSGHAGWRCVGETIEIDVPPDEVDGLADLFDGRIGRGSRPALHGLRFVVVA